MIAGVPGGLWWLAVLLLIMGGSILFTLGIMGRYLARIFDDVKGRPLYVVADTRGIPAE
jgi:dolichol-phosphate mannosyltransferase